MRIAFLVGLFLVAGVGHSEPAGVIRSTELKKDPATDAPTVSTLAENAAVDAQERKGGWVRVKAGAADGWVRLLALRYGGAGHAGDSGAGQLFSAARTGSSGTQVTTGVRGLDEQMLAKKPNEFREIRSFCRTLVQELSALRAVPLARVSRG